MTLPRFAIVGHPNKGKSSSTNVVNFFGGTAAAFYAIS